MATKNATLQFPEITLGILPGIGGCVVPYRRWPQAAAIFHEMICLGRPVKAAEGCEQGVVCQIADDFEDLMAKAVAEVDRLKGDIPRISDGKIVLPPVELPDTPQAGPQLLSKEAVMLTKETIEAGAAAERGL